MRKKKGRAYAHLFFIKKTVIRASFSQSDRTCNCFYSFSCRRHTKSLLKKNESNVCVWDYCLSMCRCIMVCGWVSVTGVACMHMRHLSSLFIFAPFVTCHLPAFLPSSLCLWLHKDNSCHFAYFMPLDTELGKPAEANSQLAYSAHKLV